MFLFLDSDSKSLYSVGDPLTRLLAHSVPIRRSRSDCTMQRLAGYAFFILLCCGHYGLIVAKGFSHISAVPKVILPPYNTKQFLRHLCITFLRHGSGLPFSVDNGNSRGYKARASTSYKFVPLIRDAFQSIAIPLSAIFPTLEVVKLFQANSQLADCFRGPM